MKLAISSTILLSLISGASTIEVTNNNLADGVIHKKGRNHRSNRYAVTRAIKQLRGASGVVNFSFEETEKDDDGGKSNDDGGKGNDDGGKGNDDGGKGDDGGKATDDGKNTDDKGTDDKKATDDDTTDDKGTDDKKKDDDDDDKKNKDDDDDKKNKDDDDDDKKDKDDDDDDDDKNNRTIILPACVTGSTNYNRCDPDTMLSKDKATCDEIEKEVCGKGMDKEKQDYCECIGLYEPKAARLRGAEGIQHASFTETEKDDDGGKGDDGGKATDDGKNTDDKGTDDKKATDDKGTDDKKNEDDDDKDKDDDDKDKDDDDDDKNNRTIILPDCVTGSTNFNRCDPDTMLSKDKATCGEIEKEVCGKDVKKEDEDYCVCIGLDEKKAFQLVGTMNASF